MKSFSNILTYALWSLPLERSGRKVKIVKKVFMMSSFKDNWEQSMLASPFVASATEKMLEVISLKIIITKCRKLTTQPFLLHHGCIPFLQTHLIILSNISFSFFVTTIFKFSMSLRHSISPVSSIDISICPKEWDILLVYCFAKISS